MQAVGHRLAREVGVQNERAGEGEDQRQQTAGDFADLFRAGIEGEAEQQQDDQRERERRIDSLLAADLRAEILAGDGERLAEEVHASPQWRYSQPGSASISGVRRPRKARLPRVMSATSLASSRAPR